MVGEYLDINKNEKVAIKWMNDIVDITDAKRMLREIWILRNFQHDGILKLRHIIANKNEK